MMHMLISDEPYREICFGKRPFVSPASVYENSFMCYSWSKAYNISGERIGYIAVNPKMQTRYWPGLIGSLSMCNRFLGFVNAPAFMQRVIAESLDAEVELYCDDEFLPTMQQLGGELRFALITSEATVAPMADVSPQAMDTELNGLKVAAWASEHAKCPRCWHHREDVGADPGHPELCGRCVKNVDGDGEKRRFA